MRVSHHILVLGRLEARVPIVVFCRIQKHVAKQNDEVRVALTVAYGVIALLVSPVNLVHVTIRLVHHRNTRYSRVLALAKL